MTEIQEDATAYRTGNKRSLVDPALIYEIRRLCEEKGWRTPGERGSRNGYQFAAYCALAISEIVEAMEAYRDKEWSSSKQVVGPACEECVSGFGPAIKDCGHHPLKPVGVGPELADALIRILDMVDLWEIDLDYELRRVMDHNWDRPYRHGGRDL